MKTLILLSLFLASHAFAGHEAKPVAPSLGGTGQSTYTDGQLLIGNTSTGGLSKATLTAGSNVTITNGGGTITVASTGGAGGASGSVYQTAYGSLSTRTTSSGSIPLDNTIPQNTEGTEMITVSITPSNASSKLRVRATISCFASGANTAVAALFRDSTANSIGAAAMGTGGTFFLHVEAQVTAGSTSATTFKVRTGINGGTLYVNGDSSTNFFGGVDVSSITVEEILP